MPSNRSLMSVLVLGVCLSTASGCVSREHQSALYPSPADLVIEPKPVLPPEAVESEALSLAHDIAIEIQRDTFAARLGRLCRFHQAMGMRGLDCPEPEPPRRLEPG